MLWKHSGRIEAGRVADPMISSYDYFPTILVYLGLNAPRDPRRVGRSYAELLRGRSPQWRDRLYLEPAYVRGIRTRNLKHIERAEDWPTELFDLEADPGETRNVADRAAYRAQRGAVHNELSAGSRERGAPPIAQRRSTTRQRLPEENRTTHR